MQMMNDVEIDWSLSRFDIKQKIDQKVSKEFREAIDGCKDGDYTILEKMGKIFVEVYEEIKHE